MQAEEQAKHTLNRDNQAVYTDLHSEIQRERESFLGYKARNAHKLRLNTKLVHIHYLTLSCFFYNEELTSFFLFSRGISN